MRILINGLSIDQRKAGIGQYSLQLINALADLESDHVIHTVLQRGIETKNPDPVLRKPYSRSLFRILDEQLLLPFVYRKYDLIHYIDYSAAVLSFKPFILTIHDLSYYEYPETFTKMSGGFKRWLASVSIRRAKKILAVSENTRKDIIRYFPEAEDKTEVIYPGKPQYSTITDKKIIEAGLKKMGITGPYILGVGTLEPRKNIERLIEAFLEAVKHDQEIKLVLVGKKGWLYESIFEKIEGLDLSDRIIWTGYVEDDALPILYSGAKVFVYPSMYEGFGLPPLEAMCCGVPVITSKTSSIPEVVGDAAVLIDPMDSHQIGEAILELLGDEEMCKSLVVKGIERSKKFDWSLTAQKVVDVYNEIRKSGE